MSEKARQGAITMRIIFVRHGHPNYQLDCLTELGKLQAQSVGMRLKDEPISRLYSSSSGRAVETGEYIAREHKLEIEQLDFMREISWRGRDGIELPHNGHPWNLSDSLINEEGYDVLDKSWENKDCFKNSVVGDYVKLISEEFDKLLLRHGYEREGLYYRAKAPNEDTIALTSHGGSSSIVLSHLFNLPLPFVCSSLRPQMTSITIVNFHGKDGELFQPRIEVMNDFQHIKGIQAENVIEN